MIPRHRGLATCFFGLLLAATPALAHHSFTAEFDGSKCTDITGTLTSYDWENPHAYFNLDVKDDSGAVSNWTFEAVSVAWMKRSGTQRRDFIDNIGKVVKVRANMVRGRIAFKLLAHSVLELPAGTVNDTDTKAGDQLEFEKYDD